MPDAANPILSAWGEGRLHPLECLQFSATRGTCVKLVGIKNGPEEHMRRNPDFKIRHRKNRIRPDTGPLFITNVCT